MKATISHIRLDVKHGGKGEVIRMETETPADTIQSALDYWGDQWEREIGDREVCLKYGNLLFFANDTRSWKDIGMFSRETVVLIPDPRVL